MRVKVPTINPTRLQPLYKSLDATVPAQRIVRMRWVEKLELTPTTAGAWLSTRANTIQTVHSGLPTHQPMGNDQWNNFFTRYIVLGSRINVTFCPRLNASMNRNGILLVLAKSDTGLSGLCTTAVENGSAVYSFHDAGVVIGTVTGGAVTLRSKYNAAQWFGKSPKENDEIQANLGTDPGNLVNFNFGAQQIDPNAGTPPVYDLIVQQDFIVYLFERKHLTAS